MSDEAQVLETSEVAAPAATPEANVEPVTQPEAPLSGGRSAIRNELVRRFEQRQAESTPVENPSEPSPAEPALVDANGRAHGPDGKFVAATEVAAPAEPQAETPGVIRIPVPEGDPLRQMGVTEIPTTPENERAIRALFNRESHRKERDEFRTKYEAEREARIRAETLAQTLQQQRNTAFVSPEVAATYKELHAVAPDVAESYLRGEMAKLDGQLSEAEQKATEQVTAEREQYEVEAFLSRSREVATQSLPQWYTQHPSFEKDWKTARFIYGTEVMEAEARGETVEPSSERFIAILRNVAATQNELVRQNAEVQRQNRLNAAANEAAARAKREEAERAERERLEAAERHKTKSPLSAIPSSAHVQGQSVVPESELKTMNGNQRRRHISQSLTRLLGR